MAGRSGQLSNRLQAKVRLYFATISVRKVKPHLCSGNTFVRAAASPLLIKFLFYAENDRLRRVDTILEHEKLIKHHGKCWWGAWSSISQNNAELLKAQINGGVDTYAFLYACWVPKEIAPDGIKWFRARLLDVKLETPKEKELIPEHYRQRELPCAFLLSDIKPLPYVVGKTPKVPGQSPFRFVTFSKDPIPEDLFKYYEPEKSVCISENDTPAKQVEVASIHKLPVNKPEDSVLTKIIDLQEEVITLQNEVRELSTYKEYYSKILGVDYLFSSEKFLESWLQDNMHKILPEIEIIDRQPNISWPDGKFGRLDLLAKNKETNDLVIIEVKTRKRSPKSGYDQFLRYTSWARKNLSGLKSKYQSKALDPTNNLSFVIITDFVDEEMKAICNDHGIQLVKIFGGLGFERVA